MKAMDYSLINFERTNIILYCRNWSETVRFYKEKLRLPVTFENEWFIELRLTDTAYLSIANSARTSVKDVQGEGITLTWKVQDLAQAKQLLDDQGIATTAIQHKRKISWQIMISFPMARATMPWKCSHIQRAAGLATLRQSLLFRDF